MAKKKTLKNKPSRDGISKGRNSKDKMLKGGVSCAMKALAKPIPAAQSINTETKPAYIVGIGASAGGLEALRALFSSLKSAGNLSFIVVQHLAPLHRSRLVELIGHSTALAVKEVSDGDVPMAGLIYITPPNADVFLEGGVLRLKKPRFKIGPKPSIDLFFKSLADDVGECSIGIVLSGTGSDGAHGVRAIKAAGGMTICQTMVSAKYDGMPKAAKQTGAIDLELAPEAIAAELSRFDNLDYRFRPNENAHSHDPYDDILAEVERHVGASFVQYKQSTVRRRIGRRVVATRCDTLEQYAKYLAKRPDEAKALFQDILISVTSFFRDAGSFEALSKRILERIRAKRENSSFRVWVVGCATGEEAFSIAILVFEAVEKLKRKMPVQIFATDLDESALTIARKATYSKASFGEFPKNLRDKYFQQIDDRFQVKTPLREAVIFAKHNATEDPPFMNLDLVSCRNVLIYFGAKLQEKVFRTIHYALDGKGLLFLGRSENAPTGLNFFELLDKQGKIYTRVDRKGELPRGITRQEASREAQLISKEKGDGKVEAELFQSVVAGLLPDSVLVDEDLKVKHVYGNANTYLNFPRGEATVSLAKLLAPEMGMEAAALVHRTQKTGKSIHGLDHQIHAAGDSIFVKIKVVPLTYEGSRKYLVGFESRKAEEIKAPKKKAETRLESAELIRKLDQELTATKEHLQTIIEEQETSNEELQALNEELQSANEELQSSNEELETTNEELQSSNEELTTLNQELNVKSSELQALNQTLQAIQNAIIYPLLIVDRNLRLTSFNVSARFLLRIGETDIGAYLKSVPSNIELAPIIDLVERAFEKSVDSRLQFKTRDRSFEVQVQLYKDLIGIPQGAVVSFVDNTEIVNALEESRFNRQKIAEILDNTPAMVTMKDTTGVFVFANRRFSEVTGLEVPAILGKTDEEVFGHETGTAVRELDFEVIKQRRPLQFEESITIGGHPRWWTSSKFPLVDTKNRVHSVCTISLDITSRVMHEKQLELFKAAVSSSNSGIMLFEANGKDFATTFVSEQLAASLAVEPSALMGIELRAAFKLLTRAKDAQIEAMAEEVRSSASCAFTINVPRQGGDDVWLEVRTARLQFDQDPHRHMIMTMFDVTQKVRDQKLIAHQQEELTRFSGYSALGEIAAGIAHEINTPLNVITTKTDLLRKMADLGKLDGQRASKVATDVEQVVRNISSIVHGLKALAANDPDKFESTNVSQLVRDTIKICEFRLHRYAVAITAELPKKDIIADCYPVQISQVLINLINNSIDAVAKSTERWIKLVLAEQASKITLRVIDSGSGIDPALAEKIMTPFFTTKKDQKGTGIGLSLSRSIARRHGGDLSLDLNSRNTSFLLELPRQRK